MRPNGERKEGMLINAIGREVMRKRAVTDHYCKSIKWNLRCILDDLHPLNSSLIPKLAGPVTLNSLLSKLTRNQLTMKYHLTIHMQERCTRLIPLSSWHSASHLER